MARKPFAALKTEDELKNYLDKPFAYTRHSVFHYTNLQALVSIVESKQLKFSNIATTNDVLEEEFVNNETKRKYFFCFMRSMQENFGMWAMYGGLAKSEKSAKNPLKDVCVKIEFDVQALKRFIEANNLKASLVAYAQFLDKKKDAPNILYCGSCSNKNVPLKNKGFLSGYIKDIAWKYEQELRIWSDAESVSIDEDFIKSLKIIPSPTSSVKECEALVGKAKPAVLSRLHFVRNNYEGKYRATKCESN